MPRTIFFRLVASCPNSFVPYMQTSTWFPEKTKEQYEAWRKGYGRLTVDEKVRYCIFQLRNEFLSLEDDHCLGALKHILQSQSNRSRPGE